jgi:hypothetical protein
VKFNPRRGYSHDDTEDEKASDALQKKKWDFYASVPIRDLSAVDVRPFGNAISFDLVFTALPHKARRELRNTQGVFLTQSGYRLRIIDQNKPAEQLWEDPRFAYASNQNIFAAQGPGPRASHPALLKESLDAAAQRYRQQVDAVEMQFKQREDFDRRTGGLFLAYYRFVGEITAVLGDALYVYPVAGPDPTFQQHADTFVLNTDYIDLFHGREFLFDAGLMGKPDYINYKNDIISERLLSGEQMLDAYDLRNYYDIERAPGRPLVFVMKGFMHIARQFFDPETKRYDFARTLLRELCNPATKSSCSPRAIMNPLMLCPT